MRGSVVVPFFISHRGCPHRCVFCDQHAISGSAGDLPTPDSIRATVAAYARTAGGRPLDVAFYGGTFTSLPMDVQGRLLEPVVGLRRDGAVRGIRLSTRPDAVSDEVVGLLSGHGVTTVELGVQSLNDRVLRAAGRGHDAAAVPPAVARLGAAGIRVGIQLMPGLPEDTPETALETLSSALALGPSFLRIYPTVVVAGTRMADAYHAGAYRPWGLDETVDLVKRMLHAAIMADVPVVRIGLQPGGHLTAPGVVVAGPYHPALGELVQSALWRDLLELMISGIAAGPVEVRCHPRRLSSVIGRKRTNLTYLSARAGGLPVTVRGDADCSPTELTLTTPHALRRGDLLKDIHYGNTH